MKKLENEGSLGPEILKIRSKAIQLRDFIVRRGVPVDINEILKQVGGRRTLVLDAIELMLSEYKDEIERLGKGIKSDPFIYAPKILEPSYKSYLLPDGSRLNLSKEEFDEFLAIAEMLVVQDLNQKAVDPMKDNEALEPEIVGSIIQKSRRLDMEKWQDDPNKLAIAIIRRSSNAQKDNTSAETQESEIRRYAIANGLSFVFEPSPIIESAYDSEKRDKYNDLVSKGFQAGAKHLIFYNNSRELRNMGDLDKNNRLIKSDKIIVHHVNDDKVYWKESSNADLMMRGFAAVMAESYSRENGTKMKAAYKTKAEGGWWPYRSTPLGYIHHKERDQIGNAIKGTATVIADPNLQNVKLVKREFELRSIGYSIGEIRKMNLESGIVPALIGKKKYSRASIAKRLKNSFYWGQFQLVGNPKVYQGKHPLIIPPQTLEAVKAINEGRAFKKNPNTNGADLFKGWLVCAHPECQRQIMYDCKTKTIKATGQKKTYDYYTCSNSRRIHTSKKYISEDKIWTQFEPAVDSLALSEDFAKDIADALNETHEKQKRAIRTQMEGFRNALKELEGKEDQFYQHLCKGVLNEAGYKRQIERVRLEREDYTRQIENLNLSISDEGMISAKKVLELAINAKSLWRSMERPQRLEFLKKVCSNQTLDGLTVRYELKKPFARLAAWKESDEWRRRRDSNSQAR